VSGKENDFAVQNNTQACNLARYPCQKILLVFVIFTRKRLI